MATYTQITGSRELFLIAGNEKALYADHNGLSTVSVSWNGTTVSWYNPIEVADGVDSESVPQMNGLEATYRYMAIGEQYGMESINAALDELHSYARSLVGGDTV
jgi:hypothetical protein